MLFLNHTLTELIKSSEIFLPHRFNDYKPLSLRFRMRPHNANIEAKFIDFASNLVKEGLGHFFEFDSSEIEDPTSRHSLDYADLSPIDPGNASGDDYFLPALLEGSNFSGGSVHKANYSSFLERFSEDPRVHRVYGGHETYGVAIRLDSDNKEIWKTLESLIEYHVLDEKRLSEIEREAQLEAWENWVEWEYRNGLEQRFDCDVDAIEGKDLRKIFHSAAEKAGEYWNEEPSGSSYWINLRPIIEHTSWSTLQDAGGYRMSDSNEER